MKKMLLLLLMPFACLAQNKKDNTVLIKDSSVTIEMVRNALIKDGFPIDKNDKDYISTDVRTMDGKLWGTKIAALKEGSNIILNGWVKYDIAISNVRSTQLDKVDWSGPNNDWNKIIFTKMKNIALSLTDKVAYIRQ